MMRTMVRGTTTAVAIGALAFLSWTGVGRASAPAPLHPRVLDARVSVDHPAVYEVTAPAPAPATVVAPVAEPVPAATPVTVAPPAEATVVSCGTGVAGSFEVIADEADCPPSAALRIEAVAVAG